MPSLAGSMFLANVTLSLSMQSRGGSSFLRCLLTQCIEKTYLLIGGEIIHPNYLERFRKMAAVTAAAYLCPV